MNTACIPKNWPSPFRPTLRSSPSSEPVKSIVLTVPSSRVWSNGSMFRHSNESTEIHLNYVETSPNIVLKSSHDHTYDPVSKRGTYLADSFFIPNCSCKIEITVPCDMPVASTSSCTFTCRSVKTISWTLSIISGVAASIGRPERGAFTCECTITVKFIYPLVYSRKRWCRCAMNIIQLSFDFFWH